jgi:glutamate synthase (ferredoxin)
MSGGIAYILDENKTFESRCNGEGLNIDPVTNAEDIKQLKELIENHYNASLSPLAQRILEQWENYLPKFLKVLPEEYRQALIKLEQEKLVTQ